MIQPTGVIIDTPGMRSLGLSVDQDNIIDSFEDIKLLSQNCKFSDCKHETEPGCKVQEALKMVI